MVPAGLIARFGVPMLALGVASTQMMCATQGTLTPWKGGGFGMFASIDGPGTRVLATQAVDDSGNQYRVVIGGPTQSGPLSPRFRGRARTFPMEMRLRSIAQALLRADVRSQRPGDDRALIGLDPARHTETIRTMMAARQTLEVVGLSRGDGTGGPRLRSVNVDVLRLTFDATAMQLRLQRVTGIRVQRGGGP